MLGDRLRERGERLLNPPDPGHSGARREVALGLTALALLAAVGTAGYVLIEGWRAMDAFYMTFITLATIGFGEVRPLSDVGRLFTVALATVGIGTFAYIATRTVQLLVTNAGFRQRAMQRRIDRMSGHYVVCGYGRLGKRMARDLTQAGRDVVVVDRRDDRAEELEAVGLLYIRDNAEEAETLVAAGLKRAAGLVLVLPNDAANVFVALTAREIRPDGPPGGLFVVARTNDASATPKLLRAGADKVISPIEIGADRMAQTILRPHVDRFVEQVLGVEAFDFDLEEATVERGALLDGRSLVDVDFRHRFNAVVVGVLEGATDEWRFNPDPTIPLRAGDTLVVLGPAEMIHRVRQEGCKGSVLPRP